MKVVFVLIALASIPRPERRCAENLRCVRLVCASCERLLEIRTMRAAAGVIGSLRRRLCLSHCPWSLSPLFCLEVYLANELTLAVVHVVSVSFLSDLVDILGLTTHLCERTHFGKRRVLAL